MKTIKTFVFGAVVLCVSVGLAQVASKQAVLSPASGASALAAIRASAAQLAVAFNTGKVDAIVPLFLPKGEIIDEEGNVYQGEQEIKDLLTAFFKRFPGAQLSLNIESIREVGPLAIEEGTRTMRTKDGALKSQFRYIATRVKTPAGWQIASIRDFADNPAPTPHDHLEPIGWLVGDWINEGADGKVSLAFKWSEDKNFLLGDYRTMTADGQTKKSLQRIGWDPTVGKIRSWLFDAEGGFADGRWTLVDDGIVVKSETVNPDGTTASATITISPIDKDHFSFAGTDRIVGDNREPDFDLTITRRPPSASK